MIHQHHQCSTGISSTELEIFGLQLSKQNISGHDPKVTKLKRNLTSLDLRDFYQTLVCCCKVISNIFSSLTFFRSFVSYLTSSLNVNVMLVIFYHDISEMLFAIIFPLSLPLLSINTNRRDHLLASHMKETQMMIWFI